LCHCRCRTGIGVGRCIQRLFEAGVTKVGHDSAPVCK
jgi:hypothetical protein